MSGCVDFGQPTVGENGSDSEAVMTTEEEGDVDNDVLSEGACKVAALSGRGT
jgi:hypothetical protein